MRYIFTKVSRSCTDLVISMLLVTRASAVSSNSHRALYLKASVEVEPSDAEAAAEEGPAAPDWPEVMAAIAVLTAKFKESWSSGA